MIFYDAVFIRRKIDLLLLKALRRHKIIFRKRVLPVCLFVAEVFFIQERQDLLIVHLPIQDDQGIVIGIIIVVNLLKVFVLQLLVIVPERAGKVYSKGSRIKHLADSLEQRAFCVHHKSHIL